jgi:hypothetical protein
LGFIFFLLFQFEHLIITCGHYHHHQDHL